MREERVKFALNHMVCPRFSFKEFCHVAVALGLEAVEYRNDVGFHSIDSHEKAREAGTAAKDAGLKVLTINALSRFNLWDEIRAEEAEKLALLAKEAGAHALVLCPHVDVEDESESSEDERAAGLERALSGLSPILGAHGLKGFIEVLGFPVSTLRFKKDAAAAIRNGGYEGRFSLLHDTFHHKGSGEKEFYPDLTGLVHISGVEEPAVGFEEMQDSHRILIGPKDRLDNIGQMRELCEKGYQGYFSFEPFSEPVWKLKDHAEAVRESIQYILGRL